MLAAAPPLPFWSIAAPVAGWLLLAGTWAGWGGAYLLLVVLGLVTCVMAAVHHAEVVAHRVGEPYGTLVLAIAITVIEVALIVSLMIAGGESTAELARDTVFAAVMIILNGIVGACLLVGGSRHREQAFGLLGVSASLATLAAIAVLTLVLPNYTTTVPGPVYSPSQLGFIAIISLVLYGTFVMVQAVRHRDYFLPCDEPGDEETHAAPPSLHATWTSTALLCVALAAVVLLPEGTAAIRAALANRLQTSLNLALGSALASIGLTIPAVAIVSLATGWTLSLGLDAKSSVLLVLSLFVASLSLGTGRTTVLQGTVHLVIFAVYLFTTIVP